MTPQEQLQAKVIALQSSGPGATQADIQARFEWLVADEIERLADRKVELALRVEAE